MKKNARALQLSTRLKQTQYPEKMKNGKIKNRENKIKLQSDENVSTIHS